MDLSPEALLYLWQKLIWPLIRLLFFISIGLIAANILESLNWTRRVAALARPLVRFGHLSEQAGAAFSVAIVSGRFSGVLVGLGDVLDGFSGASV